MSGKRRGLWWKVPIGTIGALVVLVSVALGVALSDYGLNFIRPRALKALNASIRGHVDLAKIKRNGMHITLTGVVVKDPEGRTAATVDRVVIHPALGALVRGDVVLRSFIVTRPQLDLHASPAGLNLARAFEPRQPKPPKKDTKPPSNKSMHAVVQVLRIEDGRLLYQAPQQQPPIVQVANFDARGRADVFWPGGPITVDLNASADSYKPIAAPFGFSLAVAPKQGITHDLRLQTTLEDSGLALRGTFVPDLKSPTIDVRLERAEVSPAMGNAVMPGSPLVTPFNLTGHIAGELRNMKTGEAAVDLDLATQGGSINIVASGNSEPVWNGQAHIKSNPLDLSRIVRGASLSRLPIVLDVQARGTELGKITGKLSASLLPGHLAGMKTGPVQIAASMQNERATLDRFAVSLPGVDVNATAAAQGLGTVLPRGQASVNLKMQNLQTFARAIAATGMKAPDLGGSGQVQVEVRGNLLSLYARVDARMPTVRVGSNRVHGLQANLQVPSLLKPWMPQLHVTAERLDAGGTTLLDVAVDTRPGPNDRLQLNVRTRAPVPASLSASLRWRDPGRSFVLESLALNYPATQWRNVGPAEIVLAPTLQVKHLALKADTQRLAVDLSLVDQNVDTTVRIANLDLKRLGALAGPAFPASGTVSMQLDAKGLMPSPRAKLGLQMQNAGFGKYGPFAGNISVAHEASRARGELSVAGAGATVSGKFNVPAVWPWPAQLAAEIDINAAVPSLPDALKSLDLKLPVQPKGSLVLDVTFTGRAAKPTLKVDLRGKGLAIDSTRIGDIDLRILDDGKAPLAAMMSLAKSDFAKSADIGLETRLSVSDLLRQKPAQLQASVRSKPMRLQAEVVGVNLKQVSATVAQMAPPDPKAPTKAKEVAGLLDLKVDLTGTVGQPLGDVNVALMGVRQGHWPATDGTVALGLKPDKVSLQAHAFQKGRNGTQLKLLALDAHANVPVPARLRPQAWQEATFAVKADVGPLAFQHLAVPGDALGSLRGQVQARFAASGSMPHPQISLDVDAQDVKTDSAPMGDAQLRVRYEADVPSIDLAIKPPHGGNLSFTAQTQGPLPWIQTTRPGWKPTTVPVNVKFASQDFSLAAFNGAVKTIRDIQGKLDGKLAFAGTLDKPDFSGSIKLQKGVLDVVEVGRLFDVRMDVQATEDMLKLDALRFKSGKGDGVIRFEAKRTEARGLALSGKVNLDRFPLQTPQRKIGEVFLRATAKGQLNADGITITPQIDEAKAFLEGDSPKKLQKLDFPSDVVLVRNGEPIDEDEARKYANLHPPVPFGSPPPAPAKKKLLAAHASLPIVINIKAPKNVWVYAPEGDIELGLSNDFHVNIDGETTVFGTVYVRRGTVSVLGKGFDLQDGANIRFTGPMAQPVLDVTLAHYVDSAQTRIFITLTGTPDDLKIKFRSDPIADESEIITMLLTGKKAGQGSSDATNRSAQAASIVGGLLASKLRDTVLRKLPIDVLSIAATAIEAGTYVTDDLYVGYVRRLMANPWRYENVNAVHLEYQISEGWSFEGEYGDAGAGSGDLIWKNRY